MKVVIVGAGASGLMAAGAAGQVFLNQQESSEKNEILVLERNEKAGKKLYITGKGRCNVTHDCTPPEFLAGIVSNPKFMLGAINSFKPSDTVELLENYGVPVKTERGGRVFPLSDKASDVTKALLKYAESNGAKVQYNTFVKAINKSGDGFTVVTETQQIFAERVILACGGKSYSSTGSDGYGYKLAKMLGHTLVEPKAALVPILLKDDVSALSGLSLKNVSVTIIENKEVTNNCNNAATVTGYNAATVTSNNSVTVTGNRANATVKINAPIKNSEQLSKFGEMLFTAKGVSGPVILSLSSMINRIDLSGFKLLIDLKPALDVATLDKRLLLDFEKFKGKQIKNSLGDLMPKSLIPFVLKAAKIDENSFVNVLTKAERGELVSAIKVLSFSIDSLMDIECGIVTAGGVNVAEVSPKTMESKLVSGLYFAGEMLDVDAFTGGYNIQIALSTGFAAGKNAGKQETK